MERYEAYKDSGVEWFEEIPAEWEVKKLKYEVMVNPLKDNLDKTSDELVTFLPMDSISENGEVDCSIKKPVSSICNGFTFFRENDVIVAKITPCFENGKCALLSDLDTSIGFGSTEFHVLRSRERIVSKFLYYITKLEIFMQAGEAFMYGAAGQKRVPSVFISDFPLVLPNTDEQTTIANFLDRKTAEIDALIAQKERLLELCEEEKTAIINHAVTKGIDPNAELKDSGVEWIEKIPVGWEVVKLSYGFQLIGSGTTPTAGEQKYYFNGEAPWIVTGDLRDSEITKPSRFITSEAIDAFSALKLFPVNTLLIAMYGATIGKVGILKFPAYTNQACCALADPSLFYERYAFYWFLGFRDLILSYGYGGGQPNISQDLIRSLRLHCPPEDEQTAIANFLDRKTAEIDAKIAKTQRIIELQKEYRTALISEVVTGKIKVSHLAEEEVAQ